MLSSQQACAFKWCLVASSSLFNWTHAPAHPGARKAFALMPVIAATLFEFSLRETRHTAGRTDRQLTGLRWLRPAERIRVQLQLAADETLPAEAATRRGRVDTAARRLHLLRQALGTPDRAGGAGRRGFFPGAAGGAARPGCADPRSFR